MGLSFFLFTGCPDPTVIPKTETPPPADVPGKAEVLLDDYIAMIGGEAPAGASRGLNPAIQGISTEVVKEKISEKITTMNLTDSDDLGVLLPLFVETTQETYSTVEENQYVIDGIKTITEVSTKLVTIYKVKEYYVKDGVYTTLTKRVIKNLKNTKLTSQEIVEVTGNTVGTVVSNIDTTLVKPADMGDTLQELTKGASEAVIEAASKELAVGEDKLQLIQNAVSVSASSAVKSINNIQGFEVQEDLKNSFYGRAAAGATEAVKFIQSSEGLGNAAVTTMVESITAEVVKEVVNLDTGSRKEILLSMTEQTSKVAASINEEIAADTTKAILTKTISQVQESSGSDPLYDDAFFNQVFINGTEVLNYGNVTLDEVQFEELKTAVATTTQQELTVDYTAFANKKPIPDITLVTQELLQIGNLTSIEFSGAGSTDPDNSDGGLTYTWSLEYNGTKTVLSDTTPEITLPMPEGEGNYILYLTLEDHFLDGTEGKSVTISYPFYIHPEELADQGVIHLEAAKTAMKEGLWNKAYTELDQAVIADPENQEALLWWSLLTMGNVIVDPAVQEVMTNLGMVDYPNNLEEFIQGQFMDPVQTTAEPDASMAEQDPLDNSKVYINIIPEELSSTKLPRVTIPTEIKDKFSTGSGELVNSQEYMMAILYNFQKNYPDGFNPLVDALVTASEGLNEVTRKVNDLDKSSSIGLTYDMMFDTPYSPVESVWPSDEANQPMTMYIGKGEFLYAAAGVEFFQTILYMLQSVSLEIDLQSYWDLFNPIDGTAWIFDSQTGEIVKTKDTFSLSEVANPFMGSFLQSRDTAADSMDQAKMHFIGTMSNLKEASAIISRRDTTSKFYLSQRYMAPYWETVLKGNDVLQILLDKAIESATYSDRPIYVPTHIQTMTDLLSMDSLSAWPSEGDNINLFPLFDSSSPLLSLENFVQMRTQTEPQFYVKTDTGYTPISTPEKYAVALATGETFYIHFPNVTKGILNTEFFNQRLSNYAKVEGMGNELVGHSLYPAGTAFEYIDKGFTLSAESTGSIWEAFWNNAIVDFDNTYNTYYSAPSGLTIAQKIFLNTDSKTLEFQPTGDNKIAQYQMSITKRIFDPVDLEWYSAADPVATKSFTQRGSAFDSVSLSLEEPLMEEENVTYNLKVILVDTEDNFYHFSNTLRTPEVSELFTHPRIMKSGETYTIELQNPRTDRVYKMRTGTMEEIGFTDGVATYTQPADLTYSNLRFYSYDTQGDPAPFYSWTDSNSYTPSINVTESGSYFDLYLDWNDNKPMITEEINIPEGSSYHWVIKDDQGSEVNSGTGRDFTMPEVVAHYSLRMDLIDDATGDTLYYDTYSLTPTSVARYHIKQAIPYSVSTGDTITVSLNIPGTDSHIGSSWEIETWDGDGYSTTTVSNSNTLTLVFQDNQPLWNDEIQIQFHNSALGINTYTYVYINN